MKQFVLSLLVLGPVSAFAAERVGFDMRVTQETGPAQPAQKEILDRGLSLQLESITAPALLHTNHEATFPVKGFALPKELTDEGIDLKINVLKVETDEGEISYNVLVKLGENSAFAKVEKLSDLKELRLEGSKAVGPAGQYKKPSVTLSLFQ